MRISDWSSDVCSSDLGTLAEYTEGTYADFASFLANADSADKSLAAGQVGDNVFVAVDYNADNTVDYVIELTNTTLSRSEERRVGKECVSKCRSRGSTYH